MWDKLALKGDFHASSDRFVSGPLVFLSLVLAAAPYSGGESKDDRVVKDGMMISLDYTLKGTDGKVIETSKGRDPSSISRVRI